MKSHGVLSKWLMRDEQKELFEILVAVILNVVFLVLLTLLVWPLGRPMLVVRLAKGYGLLWVFVFVTFFLLHRIQGLSRVNIYNHSNVFVVSNLVTCCLLQVGWSAFAALVVQSYVLDAHGWVDVTLYLVGLFSCVVAFFAVCSFYQGHIYKFVSLPLALASFIVFNAWPASRVIYGWFFELF